MEFDAGKAAVELPLVMLGNGNEPGLPCVELAIDSQPALFLLDTGFNAIALRREFAQQLGLEQRGFDFAAGLGGSNKVPLFRGPAVDWPGAHLRVPLYYGLDLSRFGAGRGRTMSGILGGMFFARCVVTIDYARGRVVVSDQETWQPPAGVEPTPLEFRIGQPELRGSIDGGPTARYVLDTGAEFPLTLNAPFVERHLERDRAQLVATRVMGLGGLVPCWFATLARFEAAPLLCTDCPVILMGKVEGFDFGDDNLRAGLIGSGMLVGHCVTFDYARRRMFVTKGAQPAPAGPAGITVDFDADQRGTVRHIVTLPGRPDVDLRSGDRIVAVAGEPLPETGARFHALLRERAATELTVERDGERHTVVWQRIDALPRVRTMQ